MVLTGGAAAVSVADGAWAGRGVSLQLQWGGHTFTLTSAYFPLTSTAQQAFIREWVGLRASGSGEHLLAADFNFVADVALDTVTGRARSDGPAAAALAAACPGLIDVLRRRHPACRVYLLPPPRASLARAHLGFRDFKDLDRDYRAWLGTALAARPTDPVELLEWWPALKRAAATSANRLSREAVTRRVAASQREAAALEAAAAAAAAVEAGGDVQVAAQAAVRARCTAAEAAVAAAAGAARRTRRAWLRGGEKPCPLLTRMLRPAAGGPRVIAKLKQPDGTTTADPTHGRHGAGDGAVLEGRQCRAAARSRRPHASPGCAATARAPVYSRRGGSAGAGCGLGGGGARGASRCAGWARGGP
ncbi:hypothetical protein CHLRE_07g346933v5 [Chlamydomonas reinhardtii]|uniref:Endonuclease/exonuclease/phosphatase domain-containing protein n=1 Tax=Chlamydomonas reinhardtii TaxID=3055 RepID=A0A2K3DL02_CHLRE|nr:uncharacterized protein CHLRE_07g346933v5 [Chlamydomonas reinhardtii]PNW81217.1 hypothetical protein CHLRE_07g346933v5 [Chlamydomonas reinhardtii]